MFIAHFKRPKSQHHEHHGAVWAPNFPLDTTHMMLQDPSNTLDMLRWPKARNEGPIVLMMLAQNFMPKTFPTAGGSFKNASKNHLHFLPPKHASRAFKGRGPHPYKHSLARRASALHHDGQAGLKRLWLSPPTQKRRNRESRNPKP